MPRFHDELLVLLGMELQQGAMLFAAPTNAAMTALSPAMKRSASVLDS